MNDSKVHLQAAEDPSFQADQSRLGPETQINHISRLNSQGFEKNKQNEAGTNATRKGLAMRRHLYLFPSGL